jgi:hypothetical protein
MLQELFWVMSPPVMDTPKKTWPQPCTGTSGLH